MIGSFKRDAESIDKNRKTCAELRKAFDGLDIIGISKNRKINWVHTREGKKGRLVH